MGAIGLLFSGGALFLNSLMLLGKAEEKSVAFFNILVGLLQVITPVYLIITSDQSNWSMFNNGAVFLFGFTYLYLGATILKGFDSSGLGWYSLWVAMMAIVYALVFYVQENDMVNALIWVMWAFLWFLFFLSSALKKPYEAYIGRVAFVQSWVTLTLPSLFMLLDMWPIAKLQQIWTYVCVASMVYFVVEALLFVKSTKKEELLQEIV
ncbi:AmiS/UreI family transporter [Fictibacillus barbaricus]|uniref:AmiS/UreI family transporter n=1 Tax=Fictibacillus barbaricus TaxID=182136 RepID=A0ABS2ZDP5_9BACL|nr:AmiS/UreI family transporter [Fictibacillus barbaricus]MBN3546308.1 AmiS/UreI family transporter [Fictibacillus barbaricus]GGB40090.1 acetamide transporter [Fictibacillus barbaricus]